MGHVSDTRAARTSGNLPEWLLATEDYKPPRDHEGFITRSGLAIASVLSRLRLDDGQSTPLSPSAPIKLVMGLVLVLLVSLSANFAFVLAVLACLLARVALLPTTALRKVPSVALPAAGLTALLMLPAALLGQAQSTLLVGTKVLVSVGIVLTVALSTSAHELTGALRTFHVPNLAIMTLDLALKSVVSLGNVALEVLLSLRLRSVGRNDAKGSSLGGSGGIVLLKAQRAAEDTADAMRCRGFEGEYPTTTGNHLRRIDLAWGIALALTFVLFLYLERQV